MSALGSLRSDWFATARVRKQVDRRELGDNSFYEVFGRHKHDDPLAHVGSVEAPNIHLAKVRAGTVFGHHDWVEMCIAPQKCFVTLTEDDKSVAMKVV